MGRKRGEIDPDLVAPTPLRKNRGRPPDPYRQRPTKMRHCKRHGLTEFALYGRKRPRWSCKQCVSEAVTRRHQKMKQLLVAEAGGSCAICGYDRTVINLHFHHVDPAKKSLRMGMDRGKALATYRAEAKKCVLVCANCHGEIEAGLIESPPAGTTYAMRQRAARKRSRRVA